MDKVISFVVDERSAAIDHDRMLKRYRVMMAAIGVLYPAWRYLAYYANPAANESWEQRGMIAVFFLGFTLLTYWTSYFRRHVSTYYNIIIYIWFIQVFYLMFINDMSFDYLVMGLVVIFTAGGGFLSANAMLGYYLMCILLTGATVVAKPDMQHLTFFWGIVTALIISYLGLKSLLGLFRDLRTSKAALQKRTDEFTALSSAVQTLFLPDKEEWKTDQWHVAGFYRPADGCGGDWWSYSEHDHKLSIVIGDVTGHGPGPAMMTASIASYMRALQNERPDLAMGDLLRALNRHLMDLHGGRHSEQHYLMTVHAIEVDPLSKQIHSWSAGAPSAAIFNPNHETRFLGSRGAPLGVEAHLQLGSDSAPLHSGDRILLYTDGISEMKCGDRILGDRRLLKIATNDLHLSPLAATRSLVGQLDRLRGATEQDDDYTLVVLDVA